MNWSSYRIVHELFGFEKKVFREKRSTIYNYTAFYDPLVSTENRALSRLKLTNTDNTALRRRPYHRSSYAEFHAATFFCQVIFCIPGVCVSRAEIRYYFASCIFKKLWCQNPHSCVCVSLAIPTRHDGSIETECFAFILEFHSLVSGVTTRHHPWRGGSRTRNARFTPSRSSGFQCSHQLSQGKAIKHYLFTHSLFFLLINLSWPPLKIFIMCAWPW